VRASTVGRDLESRSERRNESLRRLKERQGETGSSVVGSETTASPPLWSTTAGCLGCRSRWHLCSVGGLEPERWVTEGRKDALDPPQRVLESGQVIVHAVDVASFDRSASNLLRMLQ
jgi:hypothetical protein